jgi:hypothetical protein
MRFLLEWPDFEIVSFVGGLQARKRPRVCKLKLAHMMDADKHVMVYFTIISLDLT